MKIVVMRLDLAYRFFATTEEASVLLCDFLLLPSSSLTLSASALLEFAQQQLLQLLQASVAKTGWASASRASSAGPNVCGFSDGPYDQSFLKVLRE